MDTQKTIKQIYDTFAGLPQRRKVDGCTACCTTESELLELEKDRDIAALVAVRKLASKGMTTIGNAGDYKYFLPRIFKEIFADENFFYLMPDAFLSRIKRAGFDQWDSNKQESVRDCLVKLFERQCDRAHDCLLEAGDLETARCYSWANDVLDWLTGLSITEFNLAPYFKVLERAKYGELKLELVIDHLHDPEMKNEKVLLGVYELTENQFEPLRKWSKLHLV